MIQKKVTTEHGEVTHEVTPSYQKNGQLVLHLVSKLGDFQHEHVHTVGAENGKDSLAGKSEEEIKADLQAHLDEIRDHAEKTLAGRARVLKISDRLV